MSLAFSSNTFIDLIFHFDNCGVFLTPDSGKFQTEVEVVV